MSEEEPKKPWYVDIKERINNIDTRETILQKGVARLEEKVEWLIKLRQEKLEGDRWKIGIVLSLLLSLLNLLLGIWKAVKP